MAFDKYKDGAWMEPETIVGKHESGAWEDAEAVKRDIDGAWTEVWGNAKTLYLHTKPTSKCAHSVVSPDSWGAETVFMAEDEYATTWVYAVEGSWTGRVTFSATVSATSEYTGEVGKIKFYGEYGTSGKIRYITEVGLEAGETKEIVTDTEKELYAMDYIRLYVYVESFGNDYGTTNTIRISNIKMYGEKYITDSSYDYST